MTWEVPLLLTATKKPLPKVTDVQAFATAAVRDVQVIPSGDVMTRYVPVLLTATNKPLPKVTELQRFASGGVSEVQVMPSGEVMTVMVTLLPLKAIKRLLQKVTDFQGRASKEAVRLVQVMPSGELMILDSPPGLMATNILLPKVTEYLTIRITAVLHVHAIASGDVMTWHAVDPPSPTATNRLLP